LGWMEVCGAILHGLGGGCHVLRVGQCFTAGNARQRVELVYSFDVGTTDVNLPTKG
jgi:hypothetical protein